MTTKSTEPTSDDFLSQVTTGRKRKPNIFMVYGPEGEGKTKLVSEAPEAILLEGEDGSKDLDVARLPPPKTWEDVLKMLAQLIERPHAYKTLGIDTVDWIEPMLWKSICQKENVKTIELAAGGYGKGFGVAVEGWREMYGLLQQLRDKRGMATFVLAHHKAKEFNDPATLAPYMRYNVGLQDGNSYSAAKFWREAVDGLFFLNRDVTIAGNDKSTRGIDDGTRYLYTERRPGWDAKNRLGLPEKIMLPLGASYKALADAIEAATADDPDTLIKQIQAMQSRMAVIAQREVVTQRLTEYGKDVEKLKVLRGKVEMILGAA